jgi:hypothetical protein
MSEEPQFDRNMPLRADYGSGRYRRRIRLEGSPGQVRAAIEDSYHGMRCTVYHDGRIITNIEADLPRIPLSTCGGAAEPIKTLIGLPLDMPLRDISRHGNPRRNCTHLFDLTLLAIAHARRGECVRQYDVIIEDETEQPAVATVWLNDQLLHQWQISRSVFVGPEPLAGRRVLKGFMAWAETYYSGDQLEAARVLQKGYFVARVRRYDIKSLAGLPGLHETDMLGSCYSYSPGVVENAVRTGSERDFSETPELLLHFV